MAKGKIQRLRSLKEIENVKTCVYRYTDKTDGIVKYIGIVHKGTLKKRIALHALMDEWALDGVWQVDYIELGSRSEAEAFESHLIAYYGTGMYYNKAKIKWGLNSYLPDVSDLWRPAAYSNYEDADALVVAKAIKKAISVGDIELARKLLDLIEVNYGETED